VSELLCQILLQAEFDLVTSSHVLAVATLDDSSVALNHFIDLTRPSHSEVRLDFSGYFVKEGNTTTYGDTLAVFLKPYSRDLKLKFLFLLNSCTN